jgi:glutathione S-transferase
LNRGLVRGRLRSATAETPGRRAPKLEPGFPRVVALHERIAARPHIDAYLKSPRRIAFNEHGIFRH